MDTIKKLFKEDQAERSKIFGKDGTKHPSENQLRELEKNDQKRRRKVLNLLKNNKIKKAENLFYAAIILHHSDNPKHLKLANNLSKQALDKNYAPARWLYAITLDRYLKSQGKKQKFGTQFYQSLETKEWKIYSYAQETTDKERQKYDVPPLKELQKYAEKLNYEAP